MDDQLSTQVKNIRREEFRGRAADGGEVRIEQVVKPCQVLEAFLVKELEGFLLSEHFKELDAFLSKYFKESEEF